MKNILITGANSYIGTSFKTYMKDSDYIVDEVDTIDGKWKNIDFSKYDTILHVAGIAHVSADPKLEDLYYKINRDLAIEIAVHAKQNGVKQFIFMSSIIIYGKDANIGDNKIIVSDTVPEASDFYGDSKLQADMELQKMSDEKFNTVIIRTPMVYGPNCKGNFPKLKKIAKLLPIFPNIDNQRSMIYIDNLCEFFKQVIDGEKCGIFFPQNRDYISTKEIIKVMCDEMDKKVWFTSIFNPILKLLSKKISYINKVFGSKGYDKKLSGDFNYIVVENEESIRRSIR